MRENIGNYMIVSSLIVARSEIRPAHSIRCVLICCGRSFRFEVTDSLGLPYGFDAFLFRKTIIRIIFYNKNIFLNLQISNNEIEFVG